MKTIHLAALAVLAYTVAALAAEQVVSKKILTLEGARRVIASAMAEAKKANSGGTVAVVDDGGNLMALERLDGTFAAGATFQSARRVQRPFSSVRLSFLRTRSPRGGRRWWR